MREKDTFQKIRQEKTRFNLKTRFVLAVIATVICSIALSYALCTLLKILVPFLDSIPFIIQLLIFSLAIAFLASPFITKYFLNPVQELRRGMQNVADGDFNVRLESSSKSQEIQELIVGFNMMVEELRSTEILQSDFVSNVSHEFKTPINAIEGYATLLQNSESTDSTEQEYIDKILFNTRRISSLVSNVLLLSKIENQSLQLHKESYDIAEQIREEIVASEPSWASKDIDFEVDIEDTEYYGYKGLMHHVFGNIIGNAIKFSPNSGEIKIRLVKNSDTVSISIEDQGPGISEEAKKHIYDKFYQADTSHRGDGNGLGLALVKRILYVSGGEISVENMTDRGCRFTVSLPLKGQ